MTLRDQPGVFAQSQQRILWRFLRSRVNRRVCEASARAFRKGRFEANKSALSEFKQFSPILNEVESMLRKFAMYVVCLSALACVVPVAGAQTFKFVGAGSSAMWQNFALAGYHLKAAE